LYLDGVLHIIEYEWSVEQMNELYNDDAQVLPTMKSQKE